MRSEQYCRVAPETAPARACTHRRYHRSAAQRTVGGTAAAEGAGQGLGALLAGAAGQEPGGRQQHVDAGPDGAGHAKGGQVEQADGGGAFDVVRAFGVEHAGVKLAGDWQRKGMREGREGREVWRGQGGLGAAAVQGRRRSKGGTVQHASHRIAPLTDKVGARADDGVRSAHESGKTQRDEQLLQLNLQHRREWGGRGSRGWRPGGGTPACGGCAEAVLLPPCPLAEAPPAHLGLGGPGQDDGEHDADHLRQNGMQTNSGSETQAYL